MALIKTDSTNRRTFGKPTKLLITPYKKDAESGNYILGDETLDLTAIVADSSSLEQADPTKETVDSEFSDNPLDIVNTLGEWTFSTECIDFQHKVLQILYGCSTSTDGGVVVFPKQYEDLYCLIHLVFDGGTDVIMPFVSMASKATLAQMKSGLAKGVITGTCQNAIMRFKNDGTAVSIGLDNEFESSVFYMKNGFTFDVKDNHGTEENAWATESLT